MLVVALSCVLIKVPPRLAARPPPYHRPITTHPTNPRVTYPTDRDAASVLAVMLRYVLSGLRIRFHSSKQFALQGFFWHVHFATIQQTVRLSSHICSIWIFCNNWPNCSLVNNWIVWIFCNNSGNCLPVKTCSILWACFATIQQTFRLSRHVPFGLSIIRNTSLNCTPF